MPPTKRPNTHRRRTRRSRAHERLEQDLLQLHTLLHDVLRRHAESQLALGELLANQVHTASALQALHRQQQALDAHRQAMNDALVQLDQRLDGVETYLEEEDPAVAVLPPARLH